VTGKGCISLIVNSKWNMTPPALPEAYVIKYIHAVSKAGGETSTIAIGAALSIVR